jgi:ribonuclease HII
MTAGAVRRIGVDEAGKGPVLGSMFAAAVAAPSEALPKSVGDSKTIQPQLREDLAQRIRDTEGVSVGLAEIPVTLIDDQATDMNELTVKAHARALKTLSLDLETLPIRCDAGDTDADRFGTRVRDRLPGTPRLEAAHRADESDRVVGAASIVAKVARDSHVAELASEYGAVGSGYPSDPITRSFLADFVTEEGRLPDCARETWATSADVLAAAEQSRLSEY